MTACSTKNLPAHLVTVEPKAAQAVEHACLNEGNPAGVQLHDHCNTGVTV